MVMRRKNVNKYWKTAERTAQKTFGDPHASERAVQRAERVLKLGSGQKFLNYGTKQ